MRRVLQKAHTLVGEVKEDDRRAKDAACADHLYIQDVGNPNQQEDQHLPADTLKSHFAGQLLVRDGAHHACDVIHRHEYHQGDEQPIAAAQEIAQPPADGRKDHLRRVPKFLHVDTSVS